MSTYYEIIRKFHFSDLTVRIWIENNDHFSETQLNLIQLDCYAYILKAYSHTITLTKLAELLLARVNVNAVEITNSSSGSGVVLYRDWP